MSSTKPSRYFVLVDCNNFYVSCERVFNPKLWNCPVVVLSNNDGCVISRSQEAKALNIPMGAPYHQYKEQFSKQKVEVRSSNYALYGDMSQRVMNLLREWASEVQVYSIDEAFLLLDENQATEEFLKKIQKNIYQSCGIPLSLGLGPTKTLAKVANHFAKKGGGVYLLQDPQKIAAFLKKLPVEEVWGIGRQLSQFLKSRNIHLASELTQMEDGWIRKNLSVVGLRTAWELRGISCLELEEEEPIRKGIMSSRSFGTYTENYDHIAEALATYTSRAAERMRRQKLLTSHITVFLKTNKHDLKQDYFGNECFITLPEASDYTPHLIHYAKLGLKNIFRPGLIYKKVGICLGGLVPLEAFQGDLFGENLTLSKEKQQKLMHMMDQANAKFGKKILKLAAEGIDQPWQMKREMKTGSYTTRWDQLLTIKI